LSGLTSAGLGALVTLVLFGDELELSKLVGIVKKNAIMQLTFALEAERQHGKSRRMRSVMAPDPAPRTLRSKSIHWCERGSHPR